MTSKSWRKVAGWAIGISIALIIALEAFTRWPSQAVAADLNLHPDTRYVVVVFHGSHGKDEPTLIEVADRFAREIGPGRGVEIVRYVWSPWSDDQLRAGVHGQAIGAALGEQLAELDRLRHIRLIGHSAGAYPMNPLCEAYKANARRPARVEMTYLDPIGIRGGWDYTWGYRNFGECADYATAIYNTDDIVPGTNAPLTWAHNTDVTAEPARAAYEGRGHLWPVQYFLDKLEHDEMTPGLRSHDRLPRDNGR
jgi:hypothetical protein